MWKNFKNQLEELESLGTLFEKFIARFHFDKRMMLWASLDQNKVLEIVISKIQKNQSWKSE